MTLMEWVESSFPKEGKGEKRANLPAHLTLFGSLTCALRSLKPSLHGGRCDCPCRRLHARADIRLRSLWQEPGSSEGLSCSDLPGHGHTEQLLPH